MSPKGSVSRYRLPCFRTWTLPRSVAFSIGRTRGSMKVTPPSGAFVRGRRGPAAGGASTVFAIASSGDRGEPVRLIGHHEGIDQAVDLTIHDSGERRQVEADAMIRDPILREVVRPDLVRAIAGPDHRPTGG